MAKLSAQEFIEAIKEMTVLELNDLVKAVSYTHLTLPTT